VAIGKAGESFAGSGAVEHHRFEKDRDLRELCPDLGAQLHARERGLTLLPRGGREPDGVELLKERKLRVVVSDLNDVRPIE
jgi:hypothetical protein